MPPAYTHDYDRTDSRSGLFHWYVERKAAATPDERAYAYTPLGLRDATAEEGTWAQLNEAAGRVAAYLADNGVKPGEYVATLFPQSPQYLVTYLGVAKLGATIVPLDLRGTPADHAHVLAETDPAAFVGAAHYRDTDFTAIFNEVAGFDDIPTKYWVDESGFETALPSAGDYEWSVVTSAGERIADDDANGCTDPDTPLLVVFTSGTTGDPKGAVLTHRNVVFQGTAISSVWDITDDDTILAHLPTNHVGGATELVGTAIVSGSETVLLDAFDPEAALELIETQSISFVGNVPAMWGMLFDHPNYETTDLSSLRVAVVAGQAPTQQILGGMADAADHAATGWGLTETGGFVTLTELGASVEQLVAATGKPFPGFEVRTIDDDGEFLPDGESGEVVVRGDGVMQRYLDDAQTKEAFVDDEWIQTGDIGSLDEDGRLRLHGRKKNMFISGGYNVYPPEIEDVLTDHPDVQLATVIGVHDEQWGEVGHAFISPTADADLTEAELRDFCEQKLADYKRPAHYTLTTELPTTSLGKIDRQKLTDTYDLETV